MGAILSSEYFNCLAYSLETSPLENIEPICLKIPLILRIIFHYFSNDELLRLSLVSKLWHSEARRLMAKRGSLTANLSAYLPQKHLGVLASDLKRMKAAQISLCGINLTIGVTPFISSKKSTSSGKLDLNYLTIIDRLKWRNLSVTLGSDWDSCRNCQGILLVTKILEDKCGDLVEISLTVGTSLGEELIPEYLEERNFPSLTTLKLQVASWFYGKHKLNFVKAIVCRAPKLQRLYAPASAMTEDLFERSSAVIILTDGLNLCDQKFPESLLQHIRLETVRIGLRTYSPDLDVKRFNRIALVILANSSLILETMAIDLLLVVPIMTYGICFQNVRYLIIGVRNDELFSSYDPAILQVVKALDFTRIFPKLNKICVSRFNGRHISTDNLSELVKQRIEGSLTPPLGRSMNIKHLSFHDSLRADQAHFFSQMFPYAETLLVSVRSPVEISNGLIWEHWVNLKGLEIVIPGFILRKNLFNLDSVFCGIFPEEVAELRKKDDEYLKKVHIVPVMPSITCLKELRTFELHVLNICIYPGITGTDVPLAFSKVTHFIAFARCPYFSVAVEESEKFKGIHSTRFISVARPMASAKPLEEQRYKNNCTRESCPVYRDRFLSFH